MKKVGRKTVMKRKRGEERRVEGRRHRKLDVFLGTHDNIYWYVRKLFTLNTGKEPPKRTRNSFWNSHTTQMGILPVLTWKNRQTPNSESSGKMLRMFPRVGKESYAWAEH